MVNEMAKKEQNPILKELFKGEIPELARAYFDIVLVKGTHTRYTDSAANRIVNAFENLLNKMSIDYISIPDETVETPKDVMKLVTEGKITLTESKRLIDDLRQGTEIVEVKEILERLVELEESKNVT
jgi:hypothetical protein